jgi:hypothetical protein
MRFISTFFLLSMLTGCSELAWQAAQLPGLSGISHRMNERAFQRRIAGDPAVEVNYNAEHSNYRFMGLLDTQNKQEIVPGLKKDQFSRYQVTFYPVSPDDKDFEDAENYFKQFNLLMVERRKGKKLDVYGQLTN